MMKYSIALHDVLLHGRHGLYPEEGITGAGFLISLNVDFTRTNEVSSLAGTVDYTEIYTLMQKRFETPSLLLETLAQDIIAGVHKMYPGGKTVRITISKKNPPMENFLGRVSVTAEESFT